MTVKVTNIFSQFRRERFPSPGAENWAYLSQLIPATWTGGTFNARQFQSVATAGEMINVMPLVSAFQGPIAGAIYQQPLQSSQAYLL